MAKILFGGNPQHDGRHGGLIQKLITQHEFKYIDEPERMLFELASIKMCQDAEIISSRLAEELRQIHFNGNLYDLILYDLDLIKAQLLLEKKPRHFEGATKLYLKLIQTPTVLFIPGILEDVLNPNPKYEFVIIPYEEKKVIEKINSLLC
ncbi:hypothetical protein COV11_01195 [Candidatus Woesearchaeota archaeon CG10_big_fil_rev_8_21_14_0_10_30_7]|nr:MAG: hypothetical protein COV11_01195 [Candidatus Woesearchaeota archaeon CG10_big_fil_rev_8_21_14_0_10_30_7]